MQDSETATAQANEDYIERKAVEFHRKFSFMGLIRGRRETCAGHGTSELVGDNMNNLSQKGFATRISSDGTDVHFHDPSCNKCISAARRDAAPRIPANARRSRVTA